MKFFKKISRRWSRFKQPKHILFFALSFLILGYGIGFQNCGSTNNLISSQQNSSQKSMMLGKGEVAPDQKKDEEPKPLCTDDKSCPEQIAAAVTPYLSYAQEQTKITKTPDGQIVAQVVHNASTMAVGDVYVVDSQNLRVERFDNNGNYILEWAIVTPIGIAVDFTGNPIVSNGTNNNIQKFDPVGNFLFQWGSSGTGIAQFNDPHRIAVNAAGEIYIADNGNNRVQKFDSLGNYILQWGSTGIGNGQFNRPRGIAINSNGEVYIIDSNNNRVQKFDSSGNYILQWGTAGSGNGQLSSPQGIAVGTSGEVYVVDNNNNRIQKFDSSGNYILQWGTAGSGNGQFNAPEGIAVDTSGEVYVVDSNNNRIQKFDSSGNYILQWGTIGAGNGQFFQPLDIAIASPDQPDLVVSAISIATTTMSVGSTTDNPDYPLMGYPINPAPPVPVDVTIKNIGSGDAVIPANMSIKLFIRCPDPALCGWPSFGQANFNFNGQKSIPIGTAMTLHPGDTYTINTDSFFPYQPFSPPYSGSSTYTGPMILWSIVDTTDGYFLNGNLVPESDEINNWQGGPVLPITVVP